LPRQLEVSRAGLFDSSLYHSSLVHGCLRVFSAGAVAESKLKATVLSVHGAVDVTGRFLIEKARDKLRDVFGWELVASRKTLTTGEGWTINDTDFNAPCAPAIYMPA